MIWDCDRSDYEDPTKEEKVTQGDVAECVLFDHSNNSTSEDIVIVEPTQPIKKRADHMPAEPQFYWNAEAEPEIYVVCGSEEEDWDKDLPKPARQRKQAKPQKQGGLD